MAREILHDAPAQHESDSRLKSGVSSAVGRAGARRAKAQQFRGGPIFSTHTQQETGHPALPGLSRPFQTRTTDAPRLYTAAAMAQIAQLESTGR